MKAYARLGARSQQDLCMDATMGTTFVSASRRNGSLEAWNCKVFCGNPPFVVDQHSNAPSCILAAFFPRMKYEVRADDCRIPGQSIS